MSKRPKTKTVSLNDIAYGEPFVKEDDRETLLIKVAGEYDKLLNFTDLILVFNTVTCELQTFDPETQILNVIVSASYKIVQEWQ